MKKIALGFVTILLAALTLAGCSNGKTNSTNGSGADSKMTSKSDTTAATLKGQSWYIKVYNPGQPENGGEEQRVGFNVSFNGKQMTWRGMDGKYDYKTTSKNGKLSTIQFTGPDNLQNFTMHITSQDSNHLAGYAVLENTKYHALLENKAYQEKQDAKLRESASSSSAKASEESSKASSILDAKGYPETGNGIYRNYDKLVNSDGVLAKNGVLTKWFYYAEGDDTSTKVAVVVGDKVIKIIKAKKVDNLYVFKVAFDLKSNQIASLLNAREFDKNGDYQDTLKVGDTWKLADHQGLNDELYVHVAGPESTIKVDAADMAD